MRINNCVWLLIFHPIFLFAQEEQTASNAISLQYGLHLLSRQDLLFSPMVYQAISLQNIGLQYENKNDKRWHMAEIFYTGYQARWHDDYTYSTGTDEVKEQVTSPTAITMAGLRYSYLRKIMSPENGSWSLGGISDNQINSVDNVYSRFATFGYLGQFSLSSMVKRQMISIRGT